MEQNIKTILEDTGKAEFTRKEIMDLGREAGLEDKAIYKGLNALHRVKRGVYSTNSQPSIAKPALQIQNRVALHSVSSVKSSEVYVPDVDPSYIKWGEYSTITKVVKSRMYFPIYVSGLSGNGKTMMIEQACAFAKREYVRLQISPETDEDDLIGGFRLVNGETVFQKGPVIKAMEEGAILLIDEIDRASNKVMCLQGVLEGKPILIKKTGEIISPADGFNVIATANTKGRGSDDGRYSAASIIDDAFLERFCCEIDQKFPSPNVERKIVESHMNKYGVEDDEFVEKLIGWSNVIRKTFYSDGVEELISTRRLCHIAKAFSLFKDRLKAITMCVNRFDDETRMAFLDLYTKIDESQLDENGEIIGDTPEPANLNANPPF
jgi:cobaltochelatase CobS